MLDAILRDVTTTWGILFCLVFKSIVISCARESNITSVVTAYRPQGFIIAVSGNLDVKFLFIDGTIYDNLDSIIFTPEEKIGRVWGAAAEQRPGVWLFEEHSVTLQVGQAFKYDIFVSHRTPVSLRRKNSRFALRFDGYILLTQIFTVTDLEDRPSENCPETVTKVMGKRACGGQVIFYDTFETLREDWWQIQQYIPIDHPEYPFVSYQSLKLDPNVFVENGSLHIVPQLQEDLLKAKNESVTSGSLDLTNGCTRRQCFKVADGADILPPVVSGRVTSRSFAFTYGTVYVRAKLPQGDWLYPEILLEQLSKKYNWQTQVSSILKIALAGGNREPVSDLFSNKVLIGRSMITDDSCNNSFTYHKRKYDGFWGDDYHEYVLQWTPESISLSVDGNQYFFNTLSDIESTFRCQDNGTPVPTPFNDYVHITLGVAAGGVSVFPDSLLTVGGKSKPWSNASPKACLRFWQDRESWFPTWTQPGMAIDYIKVVAV